MAKNPPHWNESLALLLKSRCFYAVDSQRLNQTHLHSQPGLELNLTRSGRGTLHVDNEAFPLAAGSLVIIPESAIHRLEVHTPDRYVRSVLCIAPSISDQNPQIELLHQMLWKDPFRKPACLYLNDEDAKAFQTLISCVADESATQADWWKEMIFSHVYGSLALAARHSERSQAVAPPVAGLAAEVAHFVRSHLDSDLNTKAIAAYFGISREHLSRLFHHHMGITYQQYVMNQRIAAARELLTTSDFPLLEVALAVGFQSHSHFSRAFRTHVGITPTEFRRLHHMGS